MKKANLVLAIALFLFLPQKIFAQEFYVSRSGTLVIKSSDVSGAEKLLFCGTIYYKSNSGEFIIGVAFNAEPGSYPLFLLDKTGQTIKKLVIQVLDKDYPKQIFYFVPPKISEKERRLREEIRKKEYAEINRGYSQTRAEDVYKIGEFSLPFEPYRMTNEFGVERIYKYKKNPKLNHSEFHRGIDLGRPKPEDELKNDGKMPAPIIIKTINKGRIVLIAKNFSAEGNMVMIDHGLGIISVYLHLAKFDRNLKEGQTIEKGTPIGIMGSTGHSDGPHLHLMLKIRGQVVDPLEFIEKINSSFSK